MSLSFATGKLFPQSAVLKKWSLDIEHAQSDFGDLSGRHSLNLLFELLLAQLPVVYVAFVVLRQAMQVTERV